MNLGVHSIWYVCRACGSRSGHLEEPACWTCGDDSDPFVVDLLATLATLAHNLSQAGGLCAAFNLGDALGSWGEDPYPDPKPWEPGCGKAAL